MTEATRDDAVEVSDPNDPQDVLDDHYAETLKCIRDRRIAYESHTAAATEAWRADDPGASGRERAYADVAQTEWTRALAAATVIESIADTLGIPLAYDRRQWGEW